MIQRLNNSITFEGFFTAAKVGKTGLTVVVDVRNPAGTLVVTGGAATETGGGFYTYTLASGSVLTAGNYRAVFRTTDSTVDFQHLPSAWVVGPSWVENLDATISGVAAAVWAVGTRTLSSFGTLIADLWAAATRTITGGTITSYTGNTPQTGDAYARIGAAGAGLTALGDTRLTNLDAAISTRSTYAGADTPGTTTLLTRLPGTVQPQTGDAYARLGAAGAGLTALGDARLANLDATVGSRSTYGGGDTAGTTTLLARLTAGRATNLDNLDVATSTRLATAGYTAPPTDYQPRNVAVTLPALPPVTLAAAGLDAVPTEAGINARQALALVLDAVAGVLAGAATATITVRDPAGGADRIVAAVDADGNRSAITLSPPA